jgi:hypothetical protein
VAGSGDGMPSHCLCNDWPCGLVLGTDGGNTILELCDKHVVSCVSGVQVKCPHPCMLPRQGTHACYGELGVRWLLSCTRLGCGVDLLLCCLRPANQGA